LRDRLRERGIAVRRGDTFPGLGADWARITVRDEASGARVVAAVADALL
jgi:histidinol-phosphate aminotransferase